MPFRSKAQRAYMFANHPHIAERWEKETPPGPLPEHVSKKKASNFSSGVGPEDWKTIGETPNSHVSYKVGELLKSSQFDEDGTKLTPYLRRIHKIGHVIPLEKVAQDAFEYVDTGPAADSGWDPPRNWKYQGQLKRAAGLETLPPKKLTKISCDVYKSFLDELRQLGEITGIL